MYENKINVAPVKKYNYNINENKVAQEHTFLYDNNDNDCLHKTKFFLHVSIKNKKVSSVLLLFTSK